MQGNPLQGEVAGEEEQTPLSRGCVWAQMLPRGKGVAQTATEGALGLAVCLHLSPSQTQSRGDDPPEGNTF